NSSNMPLCYLLDTNICIYIAKQKPAAVLRKFEELSTSDVAMSLVTYGELYYGAQKSQHPKKAIHILNELASLITPLDLPSSASKYYGEVRCALEKKGQLIGNNDLWIAAH